MAPKRRDDYETKLQRMLLWFERQLPEHDLEPPNVEAVKSKTRVLTERPYYMGSWDGMENGWHATGGTSCRRCGRSWSVRGDVVNGRVWVSDEEIDNTALVIERVTAALARVAARTKCWGDVPPAPTDNGFAALGGARPAQFQDSSTTEQPQ